MMALMAKDATFTSALHLQPLPMTPRNIVVQVFRGKHDINTSFDPATSTSTVPPVQNSIVNPTVIDGDHHDSNCLVDLAAIQLEILCTSAMFSDMINTLTTPPMLAVALQATIMLTTMTTTMTPVSMDVDDNMPNNDHCQPMDLLALQQEIQQTMDSMTDFFDSLQPILGSTICTNNQSNGQSGSVALPDNPTMESHLAPSPIAPCKSQEYFTL